MSLKERIQEDWKNAMKAKDSFRASVLNMAKAAILYDEKLMVKSLMMKKLLLCYQGK